MVNGSVSVAGVFAEGTEGPYTVTAELPLEVEYVFLLVYKHRNRYGCERRRQNAATQASICSGLDADLARPLPGYGLAPGGSGGDVDRSRDRSERRGYCRGQGGGHQRREERHVSRRD